jgi:hypothetical protein
VNVSIKCGGFVAEGELRSKEKEVLKRKEQLKKRALRKRTSQEGRLAPAAEFIQKRGQAALPDLFLS